MVLDHPFGISKTLSGHKLHKHNLHLFVEIPRQNWHNLDLMLE